MTNFRRLHKIEQLCIDFYLCVIVRERDTYSVMASLSAMPPSTMRWMMEPCSSSDKLRWDTRGVDSFVAGEGSTP